MTVTSLAKADVDLERRRMYIRRGKSRAARKGIDLATLAKIPGHNSIRIAERYVYPTDASERCDAPVRTMALAQARPAQRNRILDLFCCARKFPNQRRA